MRLVGKVKKLTIGPIDAKSHLDASSLEVQEVVFNGAINGRSYVKVRATNGTIEFRAPIDSQSTVWAYAVGGKVTFGSPANRSACIINGDAKVHVTAQEVLFWGAIDGTATTVKVLLTKGGKLMFTDLAGSAKLQYRKYSRNDPDTTIEQGKIADKAKFERQN